MCDIIIFLVNVHGAGDEGTVKAGVSRLVSPHLFSSTESAPLEAPLKHAVWPYPPPDSSVVCQEQLEEHQDQYRPDGYKGGRGDSRAWRSYIEKTGRLQEEALAELYGGSRCRPR